MSTTLYSSDMDSTLCDYRMWYMLATLHMYSIHPVYQMSSDIRYTELAEAE